MWKEQKANANFLNVGCGKRFDPSWTNIDILPVDPQVMHFDVTEGFPFADNAMEVVYHSHVLEHMSRQQAPKFLQECFRVLQPGGLIRVAVPDLEQIVNNYLKFLKENLSKPTDESRMNYDWTMIELYDQAVRDRSGGEMIPYLQGSELNREFILARNGEEVRPYLFQSKVKSSLSQKLAKFNKMSFGVKWNIINSTIASLLHKILPGNRYYKLGKFMESGEIHKWMYDRYSLGRLLENAGFINLKVQEAFSSGIKNWDTFKLDGENGVVFKPDSLFMEAIKPHGRS